MLKEKTGRVTFMPLNRLKPKTLQPLIHQMLNLSWKNYVLIANTKKPSSKSSARRACVETLRSLLPMNTSVNGRLPVLVLFHGQSYFTLFLIYTKFRFRSAGQTGSGFASGNTYPYHPDLLMRSSTRPFIVSFEYHLGQSGFLGQYTPFASR